MKLQYIIAGVIVFILVSSFVIKKESNTSNQSKSKKDLEFTNTTLMEVDEASLVGYTFATYGVRDNNILTLNNIIYKDVRVDKLTALKGVYNTQKMVLSGKVDLHYKDGIRSQSQNAIYHKELSIVEITTPFLVTTPLHTFRGKSFVYDMKNRIAKATKIDALLDIGQSK